MTDDAARGPTMPADTAITDPSRDPTQPAARGEAATTSMTRYRLGAQLGHGGMGEVISARDDQIGRAVAIKRMRDANPDAKTTARFLREAQIQGQLEHPAIVPVHELSRDAEGRPFFAMKQLAGVTLLDVIGMTLVEDPATLASFPRQRLLRAFSEVCLAIEFAHTRNIVHRDLKPANIMLGEFGEVYVLDWGIARVIGTPDAPADAAASSMTNVATGEASTQAGAMLGTPGYMSPEQLRGDVDLDGRADVYALGCILFEILTCAPLHARGKTGIVAALEGKVETKPSVRAPDRDIPPELDAACVKATALDRDARISSARGLGDLVQRYLDGDRDLAMRQDLARRELAMAKDILDGGLLSTISDSRQRQKRVRNDEVTAYASAMRAAARALALDPKSHDAAELVGRLMIEPPTEPPPEVEAKLAELELQAISNHARLGVKALLGYLIFFPIIWLGGIRESWLVFGGAALVVGIMIVVQLIAEKPTVPRVFASLIGQVLLIGLYSRGLSPLLIAPGVALITVMIYASHRMVAGWLLWLGCAAGVLIPLVLEFSGLISPTTTIEGSNLVFHLPADHLDSNVAIVGLAAYIAVILSIATVLTRLQTLDQRESRRLLQMQAWQLEQLVPKAT